MEKLIPALVCFDKATSIPLKERQDKGFISFDTLEEAIKYINAEVTKASSEGRMMIMPSLGVKGLDQYKLFSLLRNAGYKVYRGLAGDLYAISWEIGTPFEED